MAYDISFACASHMGNVRLANQDNFICDGQYMDPASAPPHFPLCGCKSSADAALFGVFDGLGGEEQGEQAAYIAAKTAAQLALGCDPLSDLTQLCLDANAAICAHAQQNGLSAMGTTAALLSFLKKQIVLCNIGDSRIYRLSRGTLQQLSRDHVAAAPFGTKPPLSQNLGIPPTELVIEPYLAHGAYHHGDVYLICSDGLTDMVSEDDLHRAMRLPDVEQAATALLDLALAHGGKDNVTLLLCRITRTGVFRFCKNRKKQPRKGHHHVR